LTPPDSHPESTSRFAVVVHDVVPALADRLVAVRRAIAPLVGDRLSSAVVPCWHGAPLGAGRRDARFLRLLERSAGDFLMHGFSHRQDRPGLIAALSGRSNELDGLSLDQTRRRLEAGRAILARSLARPVEGFVPPAWRSGRAGMAELARQGFRFRAGFASLESVDAPTLALATWSWDWGVLAPLGPVGARLGDALHRLRPGALPCVVLHPADADRGLLPRAVRVVERLLGEGRSPVLLSEISPARAGATSP
jgi:predicted deacetylase